VEYDADLADLFGRAERAWNETLDLLDDHQRLCLSLRQQLVSLRQFSRLTDRAASVLSDAPPKAPPVTHENLLPPAGAPLTELMLSNPLVDAGTQSLPGPAYLPAGKLLPASRSSAAAFSRYDRFWQLTSSASPGGQTFGWWALVTLLLFTWWLLGYN